jgi:hypothetical protein
MNESLSCRGQNTHTLIPGTAESGSYRSYAGGRVPWARFRDDSPQRSTGLRVALEIDESLRETQDSNGPACARTINRRQGDGRKLYVPPYRDMRLVVPHGTEASICPSAERTGPFLDSGRNPTHERMRGASNHRSSYVLALPGLQVLDGLAFVRILPNNSASVRMPACVRRHTVTHVFGIIRHPSARNGPRKLWVPTGNPKLYIPPGARQSANDR